jgi:hypothetical protein
MTCTFLPMPCKPLILLVAEVHGNRTHLRTFGPYTGFEVLVAVAKSQ